MRPFVIEDSIPLPTSRTSGKYPWHHMRPGQSVVLPLTKGDLARIKAGKGAATVPNAARAWLVRNQPGWKATCRVLPDGQHIRVWFSER